MQTNLAHLDCWSHIPPGPHHHLNTPQMTRYHLMRASWPKHHSTRCDQMHQQDRGKRKTVWCHESWKWRLVPQLNHIVVMWANFYHVDEAARTCTVEEDLCLRVVVVDIMVVVSMNISGGMAVLRAEPATLGTSPTNLTLPFILTLALPSAAMLNTLRPL